MDKKGKKERKNIMKSPVTPSREILSSGLDAYDIGEKRMAWLKDEVEGCIPVTVLDADISISDYSSDDPEISKKLVQIFHADGKVRLQIDSWINYLLLVGRRSSNVGA